MRMRMRKKKRKIMIRRKRKNKNKNKNEEVEIVLVIVWGMLSYSNHWEILRVKMTKRMAVMMIIYDDEKEKVSTTIFLSVVYCILYIYCMLYIVYIFPVY